MVWVRGGALSILVAIQLPIWQPGGHLDFSGGTKDSDYSISDSPELDLKILSISLHRYYTLYIYLHGSHIYLAKNPSSR
jgi:hypothetical protein